MIATCRQHSPRVRVVQIVQRAQVRQDGHNIAATQQSVPATVRSKRIVAQVQVGGLQGERGPAGDSDKHYRHDQAIPAATWVVAHGLGKYPAVTVVESSGDEVEGDIAYDSLNQCTLRFAGAFSGKAFFN